MSAQVTEREAAIKLIVEQDKEGQVAANVPVRWKISSEMIQTLASKTVDPFMLLVVTNGGYEMDRILLPLKSGMTFIQMRRPGTNVIHATIVWQRGGCAPVKRIVNEKDDYGNYELDLVRSFIPGESEVVRRIDELDESIQWNEDGLDEAAIKLLKLERKQLRAKRVELRDHDHVYGLFDAFRAIERSVESDEINVEVPDEMFAPTPPRWMTKLGTMYKWPRKAQDQCDLRRRAIFTAFSLPFVAVIAVVVGAVGAVGWTLFKLAAALWTAGLLFFGMRNINFSVIYEWKNLEFRDISYRLKPSFWTYKKVEVEHSYYEGGPMHTEIEYQERDVALQYINPPFMLLLFVVERITNVVTFDGDTSILVGVVRAVIGAFVVGGVASLIARLLAKRKQMSDDRKFVTAEQKSKLERDLAALTSGGAARLSELPKGQRTVRLRFLNLKASVCKPFAR